MKTLPAFCRPPALAVVLAVVGILGLSANGQAQPNKTVPNTILIIRHAEKPDDGTGLLQPQGVERANALYKLFVKSADRPNPFPTPDYVFATQDSAKSERPRLTVAPLVARLKLDAKHTNFTIANKHTDKVADEIFGHSRYAGKTILICWHHGEIPQLTQDLARKVARKDQLLPVIPAEWPHPKTVFDQVWQLSCRDDGKIDFRINGQHLMPWDKSK